MSLYNSDEHLIKRIYKILLIHPLRSISIFILTILAGFLEGIGILAFIPVLTSIQNSDPSDGSMAIDLLYSFFNSLGFNKTIETMLIFIVVVMILKSILMFYSNIIVTRLGSQTAADLRLRFIQAILAARWSYFINEKSGAFSNALGGEANAAAQVYSMTCNMLSRTGIAFIYLLIASMAAWEISVAGILCGVFLYIFFKGLNTKSKKLGKEQALAYENLAIRVTDGLLGMKALKAMSREKWLLPILSKETEYLNKTNYMFGFYQQMLRQIPEPIIAIILALGIYYGVTYFDFQISFIIIVSALFYKALNTIREVQSHTQKFMFAENYYYSYLKKIKKAEASFEEKKNSADVTFNSSISFNNVTFSYGKHPVIKKATFHISRNKITALSGVSGSGKTTLLDLLLGLQIAKSGSIKIDDVNLNDIDITKWRNEIGYVPQEHFLFSDTLRTNLSLGDSSISDDDIYWALELAGCKEFVAALPNGLDFKVSEKGGTFSGGQKQRLMIARALARKPKLLILDEPTSALDAKTEAEFCKNLKELNTDIAILAITHQAGIRNVADSIIDVSEGIAVPR
ncbi:ABC transporter ATP-binding protein [Terasakiella sp. SH-1]|uniref:ABC transporter ATP-binding protein n=1 Tax=Terasakiella sp. SH-1 TaxID=2560057 RepID=UPI00107308BE|nr:ABC transporter ATP-binding protein [Terasakiella sp. SH-1]